MARRILIAEDEPSIVVSLEFLLQGAGYRTLDEGSKVEFEVVEGPKGKQASTVTRV